MKIGIVIFAYNRSWHLQQVLEGLQKNTGVDTLHIFQDGLKCEAHRQGWEATTNVVKKIAWCKTVYELSSYNKGLAESIVYGINKVFEEHDAVIVLEDDCVPAPGFVSFMKQCFEKYEDNKQIYSVSGYSWPLELTEEDSDIYFCGRISSWGWGTWKDRWEQYKPDNMLIKKIKASQQKSENLAKWGKDLEDMLIDNIRGESDSWAVYWALTVIEKEGLCINPYRSLIQNIGMDGTGTHCGMEDRFEVKFNKSSNSKKFQFPNEIEISRSMQIAFTDLYGSYSAIPAESSKEKVLVYGLGNFYFANEKEMNQKFRIMAFLDKRKKGWYAGKRILPPVERNLYTYDKIIIMLQNIQECINVSKMLIDQLGVDYHRIKLGHSLYGHYKECFQSIDVLQDGSLSVSASGITVKVSSLDEFNNVYEVLVDKNYDYTMNNKKRDVVFDVGMNIGDATLFFLKNKKVEKVYAFEPFRETFLAAQDNLSDFLSEKGKLELFPYGLSDVNEKRMIAYNGAMSCGQSTIAEVRDYAKQIYQDSGLLRQENERQEQIAVRKASDVFAPIMKTHIHNNLVLKMDCEGEEYAILKDLSQAGLLKKFDFIMLEWHYRGKETLLENLKDSGFSYWCSDKSDKMGLIYAYRCN